MSKLGQPQPKEVEKITVRDFFDSYGETLKMRIITGEQGLDRYICEKAINRPALPLTGYFKYFAKTRIQLFGAGEMAYLRDQTVEEQARILEDFCSRKVPCIVISRDLAPLPTLKKACERHQVPLLRSSLKSKDYSAEATLLLEAKFAPTSTIHGTLLDIRGIGTLLRGQSGVGKSECALALIERGHSLVADDLVFVKLVGDSEVIGSASELNFGYMECRGIGIINIAELFGVRSVRLDKRIDLIINFIEWQSGMDEERTGLEDAYFDLLGRKIPMMEIPVRPGRDMGRLVEVAAMVQALKLMGHDSAKEFNERLISFMTKQNS